MCVGGEMYLGVSPDGTQQLGAIAHRGGSVGQRGGKLGRLSEVMLQVLWGLVLNSCEERSLEYFDGSESLG